MDAKFVLAAIAALSPAWCSAEPPLQPVSRAPGLSPRPASPTRSAVDAPGANDGGIAFVTDRPADEAAGEPPLAQPEIGPLELPPPGRSPTGDSRFAGLFDVRGLRIGPAGEASPSDTPQVRLARADLAVPKPTIDSAPLQKVEALAAAARTVAELTYVIDSCGAAGAGHGALLPEREALSAVESWALNRRGELLAESGDDHAAYDDFARAIRVNEANWSALHNRGLTLAAYGRRDAALVDISRAIELHPSFALGLANRADLLLEGGRLDEAASDFSRALAVEPENVDYLVGRAAARQGLGDLRGAVQDLNSAIRLEPRRAESHAARGALYARVGYFEQAVADFDAALVVDPECLAAYQSLAWLLSTCADAKFRDAGKALASAERALKLGDPGDPMLLEAVAAAYASAGETIEAARYQQQAVLLAPAPLRAGFEQRLALYRAGKPYRAPQRR